MTDPAQHPPSLGFATLALARSQLVVREVTPNRGPEIDGYLLPCVRGGRRIWRAADDLGHPGADAERMDGMPEGWFPDAWNPGLFADTRRAATPLPPIGYRASVAELCLDARATGALRLAQAGEEPGVADLLVFGRGRGNPLRGGEGHVGICSAWGDWGKAMVAGNDLDQVREVTLDENGGHPRCGQLLAWIVL